VLRRRHAAVLVALGLALPASAGAAPHALSYRLRLIASGAATGSKSAQAAALGLPATGAGSVSRYRGRYVAEIRTGARPAGDVRALRAAGARILHVSTAYDTITAAIDRADLDAVASVAGVQAVTEVLTPEAGSVGRLNTCTGATTSEADTQLRAALARTDLELDGAGVKVGVLSDSFDTDTAAAKHAADDIASGDLPGAGNPCARTTPVSVVQDFTPSTGHSADEGRAMIQAVHDLAPGAGLAFATAFISETSFADNIVALKDAGANVIADDVIYSDEPFFQDGPIANAVSQVTDAGVAYFSMAFNDNERDGSGRDITSWEAPAYRPTPCPAAVTGYGDCMDFDPGGGTDSTFGIGLSGSNGLRIDLQWNEPRGGVSDDFDLYLLDPSGNVMFSSQNVNATTQTPYEFAGFTGGSGTWQVVIARRSASTGTPRLKFVVHMNGAPISSFEYPASSGVDTIGPAIFGHNGTAKAQTIGAIAYNNASVSPETYSSRGPVTHYFGPVGTSVAVPLGTPEVLSKPDVTATDCAQNTFFGSGNRFCGTSQATPHAAAVAALELQGNPGLTPAQVKSAQASTATAIGAFGPLAVGAGLIDARAAVALDLLPPVVTATPPAATNDTTPAIPFTVNRPTTGVTCAVDAGAPASCASPFTPAAALAEGAHTVTIAATDRATHTGTSGPVSFTVDLTPPVIATDGPALTNQSKPTFTFSGSEALSGPQCEIDGGGFAPCTGNLSHAVPTALGDGVHTFQVRATDAAGNVGTSAARPFTVDTVAPGVPNIGGAPSAPIASTTPTFSFTGDSDAAFECRLDAADFAACASPYTPPALGQGAHAFSVRAVDAAGNASAEATRSFTVDTEPPTVTITAGPSGSTRLRQPTFTFSASEPAVTFLCRLDGADRACSGPTSDTPPEPLRLGTHTFAVTATDAVGNAGSASRTFTVIDRVKPVLRFTRRPKSGRSRKARIAVSASEPLAKLECRLDKAKFKQCKARRTITVKPGKHTLRVRGTDAAGNVGAQIKVVWKVKKRK
jgi:hypothetical protein